MTRVWFAQELETVATYWRIMRRDGVGLGFTSHDTNLWFDGLDHRAAPGMMPSAIRRSANLEPDSAEVEGALSHDGISAADLAAGRFDGARVLIGLVDWETLERYVIYQGSIGTVSDEGGTFSAALTSRKTELLRDPVPRTSPLCRAVFCGPGCALSAARFSHAATVVSSDTDANSVTLSAGFALSSVVGGQVRWLDGELAGFASMVVAATGSVLTLASPIDGTVVAGERLLLREGCDRTIATCAARFGNGANFRGEPYLPGNDLITRYPTNPQ